VYLPETLPRDALHKADVLRGVCSDFVAWYRQCALATFHVGVVISGVVRCHQQDLLPQVRGYLDAHPTHWVDLHVAVNALNLPDPPPAGAGEDAGCGAGAEAVRALGPAEARALLGEGMDAPFVATLTSERFEVDPPLLTHPRRGSHTPPQRVMSMFHFNKRAHEQLERFVAAGEERWYDYDVVCKFRSDVKAAALPDFEALPLDDDSVHVPDTAWWGGVNDQVAAGKPGAMRAYFNLVDAAPRYLAPTGPDTCSLHPETMLKHHLARSAMHVRAFSYRYQLDHDRFAWSAP
jgi:hypothetical protein